MGTQAIVVGIIETIKRGMDAVKLTDANSTTIEPFVWTIFLLSIALIIIRTASRMFVFTPGRMIEYRIRRDYFSRLLYWPRELFFQHEAGDLISRCSNDINFVRVAYGFGFLQIANVSTSFLFAIGAMVHMDLRTTIYMAIPTIIIVIFVQASAIYVIKYWRLLNFQLGKISAFCLTAYKAIPLIQAYHAERSIQEKFDHLNDAYLKTNQVFIHMRSFIFPLVQISGQISIFILLWFLCPMAISKKLTMGEIMAFLAYIAMIMPPLQSFVWMITMFQRAFPAAQRLDEILTLEAPRLKNEKKWAKNRQGSDLCAKKLCFEYKKAKDRKLPFTLKEINFELPIGKVLGITGKVGCGKTTLLETILRVNPVNENEFWIDGIDASQIDLQEYRKAFSVAPQRPFLFSMSLRENLRLAMPTKEIERKDLDEHFAQYLKLAGFELDPKIFPQGLDTVVGEKGILLSGGQRQRIALARSLLKEADIYILDDVLSAVDYETEKIIIENLRKFFQKKSLIISSHRISAIQWADEICILDQGSIIARGNHNELLEKSDYYRQVFQHQTTGQSA